MYWTEVAVMSHSAGGRNTKGENDVSDPDSDRSASEREVRTVSIKTLSHEKWVVTYRVPQGHRRRELLHAVSADIKIIKLGDSALLEF